MLERTSNQPEASLPILGLRTVVCLLKHLPRAHLWRRCRARAGEHGHRRSPIRGRTKSEAQAWQ